MKSMNFLIVKGMPDEYLRIWLNPFYSNLKYAYEVCDSNLLV